jgi:uncharacterized protein YbjT (DUF2867 family)
MIIVTGANGQLGRQIVERLVTRVPAAQIGASVREPEKAEALRASGVRVRAGSFTDGEGLRHAFEGATTVLIVSSSSIAGDTLVQHRTAIDAARAVGAKRIVYTSHMGSSATSKFPPMRNHAATEAMLAGCGVPFTSLRNGFYAASALMYLGGVAESGKLVAPADGPVSWTAHADLAEAAAIVLAASERGDDGAGPDGDRGGAAATGIDGGRGGAAATGIDVGRGGAAATGTDGGRGAAATDTDGGRGGAAATGTDVGRGGAALAGGGARFEGATPALTASAAIDLAGLAAIASEIVGRPVERVVVSDDEFRAGLVARGVPAARIDIAMGLFAASRDGEFAAVDPTLARLIGRPPIALREVVRAAM